MRLSHEVFLLVLTEFLGTFFTIVVVKALATVEIQQDLAISGKASDILTINHQRLTID